MALFRLRTSLYYARMEDQIILVDEQDREIGTAGKLDAHRAGQRHRAFSIFVFNPAGQLLLQKRASKKYHSGGLWSNTCCSHPRPGASLEEEAHRRLKEEMGFECDLQRIFSFEYRVQFENDLWENEIDHVFVGGYDGNPSPDPEEAEDWKWMDLEALVNDVKTNPESYSYWLRISIDQVLEYWVSQNF